MSAEIGTVAAIVSAAATLIYAVISAVSLWLLSQQIRDARRFGAVPALYAILKELEEHMAAVRLLGDSNLADQGAQETISRILEFFERIEHLRSADVLPATLLRRAFGPVLKSYLADARFIEVMRGRDDEYNEVLTLAKHII